MNKLTQSALLGTVALIYGLQASAAMYDLSSSGSDSVTVTGGTGGTALFNTIFDQPAGTGYIEPFLRTQLLGQPGDYCGDKNCEQAYNTDGVKEYDTKDDNQWNHALLLSDIPVVTINGVEYREFLLDINQNQGNPDQEFLSLSELQFFISGNQFLTGYNDAKNSFNGGTSLVWELDAYNNARNSLTTDNWLLLENCKSPGTCGSGDYDMQALIPSDVFGADESVYVTLFNRFGDNAGTTGANDGFEEWAVRIAENGGTPPSGVSEPGILSLVMLGLLGMISTRRRLGG